MHTSSLTYALFLIGIMLAAAAQIFNYLIAIIKPGPRPILRTITLITGLSGIGAASLAGYRASIDWSTLPSSPEGLRPGQLWNNGGIPAIVQSD